MNSLATKREPIEDRVPLRWGCVLDFATARVFVSPGINWDRTGFPFLMQG
jgi:hypothetical protein